MKRGIIKAAILVVVFITALFIVSGIVNQRNTDMTTEMHSASYPVLSMHVAGHEVNLLHGYAQSMDTAYIRDYLLPVGEKRNISVMIDTYGSTVEGISFEVRSLDGERLVEDTEVTKYTQTDKEIYFDITLKDLIAPDTEYMLVFLLKMPHTEPIRYYTRIVQNADLHIKEKLDYVRDFHEKTFDKEEAAELTKYLESNAEGDNTTFCKVNIHSSFEQVTWGNLAVRKVNEPVISIRELDKATGSFSLEYLVAAKDDKGTMYFRVKEFYRIRFTTDRMYLLDFERTMEQVLDEDADVFVNDKIVLGIVDSDIDFRESDGGNVFAFVSADKLYSYNVTDNKLARIFSFYGNTEDLLDERCAFDKHDIKILNVDETGKVVFAVYGYMNRGNHEGCVGMVVYIFNSLTNTTEELIYIPYEKSYELLKTEVDKLSYVNKDNQYYFMLQGCIYEVDLDSKHVDILAEGLVEGGYQVSNSDKMVVWQDTKDVHTAKALTLMNLNTKVQTSIEASAGDYISILGFLQEDLIYGYAKQNDITKNATGAVVFPMYCINIRSENGDILKSYEKEGIYVTEGEISDNQINLTRVEKDDEQNMYYETSPDQIVSTGEITVGSNSIRQAVTEKYETITQIVVKDEIDRKSLKLLTPKEVLYEGNRSIELPVTESAQQFYYVYGKNGIEGIFTNAGKAVQMAYDRSAVVVDDDGRYIWRRTSRSTRNQIMAITEDSISETRSSMAVCIDTILKLEGISRNTQHLLDRGESVVQILQSDLGEYTILDLSGCSLDAVLYYVNMDIPVLTTLRDGNAALIVGFNELNIVVMDPLTGTLYKKGMNDSTQWLNDNGNQFIAYIRKEE